MTGLDPLKHVIVEIATLLTDDNLVTLAEGPDLVVRATTEELGRMGEFVTAMHEKSGLLPLISESTVSRREAELATLKFLIDSGVEPGTVPLCGNSIGTDRRFLQEYMPELEAFLHYRNVDVSTIKELVKRWRPSLLGQRPEKATNHRALDDIRESIEELSFYRSEFFVNPASDQNDGVAK